MPSVRTMELLVAVALALCSIAIMVKSTDGLAIGWIRGSGPGAGMWPFWLSTGMLLCCVTIIFRWFMRATPQARSSEPFMTMRTAQMLGTTVAALLLMLLATPVISIYFALLGFLFFYFRMLGGHGWLLSIVLTLAIPTVIFFFFEGALKIPLPKGMVEPVFYPLYDIIY